MPIRKVHLIRAVSIPACLLVGFLEFFALLRVQALQRLR